MFKIRCLLSSPCWQIQRKSLYNKAFSEFSRYFSKMAADSTRAVEHDQVNCNFSINLGNVEKAMLYYEKRKNNVYEITHTFVPEACRGQGLAGILMKVIISDKFLSIILKNLCLIYKTCYYL